MVDKSAPVAEAEEVRGRWLFLAGTLVGCSPLVSDEGEGASSNTTSGTGNDTASDVTTTDPSAPNPTAPNPTATSPTSPVTTTPTDTIGTTTIGVDVDTGDFDTGDFDTSDTSIVFDHPLPPEEVCIPLELHGPLLEAHPSGWMAVEGCDPDSVILQTEGAPPLLTSDEVGFVSSTYGMALFGMPGAVATGMDLCCSLSMDFCLTVDVVAADLQLNESLAYANELFASLEGGCIGVRFNLVD